MTAIDFTGYNDVFKVNNPTQDVTPGNRTLQSYHLGWDDNKKYFYQPLLDDDGLQEIYVADLTSNLLAYTTTGTTAANKTNETVSAYLGDAQLTNYESHDKYRKVAVFDRWSSGLRGHWVQLTANGYRATRDHLLIDRQDFNAPIAYTFNSGQRMWYQREPDSFVDRKMGWEAVSLPFSAELVTTDGKGEITHFYSGSAESKNGTGTKVGHEYWLRELTENGQMTEKSSGILEAKLHYPSGEAGTTSDVLLKKDVENTFLWDYYYKGVSHKQHDLNSDDYQTYYSDAREYKLYPMVTKGTPYVIGFPGSTYYEFDLSGNFEAKTTAESNPVLLTKQVITFASADTGITIGVSDDEMAGVSNKYSSDTYTFKPSYLNEAFKAGSDIYTLVSEYDSNSDNKADCSSFVKVPAAPALNADPVPDTEVYAFRPYFTGPTAGARVTRSIVFSNEDSQLRGNDDRNLNDEETGCLSAYSKKRKIVVESSLREAAEVSILNTAGITVATFTIQPGETIETRVNISGIYVIQSADGQYTKKLSVR